MTKINKKEIVKKILIEIKPEIKSSLNNNKINLINDGIIDSFDIIRIIHEIDKINKRKIDPKNVHNVSFSSIENIAKLLH
ncbi:MAG: hypothetical protein EVA76_01330 [Candidatus Pelagibacterales bacterium]|nr:MAG: hypothetical protein EVA76_01330 [Pelagibacterales bacterium]